MDINKFKKEYNLCKYRIDIINEYYNKYGKYINKKEYYDECYIYYETINNIIKIQNDYLLNDKNKKSLKNIKEKINETSFLLSYKMDYCKNLIDMYLNINTYEYDKIFELITYNINYIKLINNLQDFFNENNEIFYNKIKDNKNMIISI